MVCLILLILLSEFRMMWRNPFFTRLPYMKHSSRPRRNLGCLMLGAFLATALPAFSAIVFVNPDLEGSSSSATVPTGWTSVSFDAPFSEATTTAGDDADVVGITGPDVAGGIFGAAHSGFGFLGGAHGTVAAVVVQEGLQQTVSGFTVGEDYSFSFFQANVGITSRRDTEGSWRVFANGLLVGTTIPTTTSLAWDDPDKATALLWEERTATFTATAESMTLSFLAYDSDGDIAGQNGVYMGTPSPRSRPCRSPRRSF